MIAEYANGEWIRDYVYGASGEAVYMRFPRTDEMIAAHDSFFGFLNAWLCSPYCTQDDLLWDTNADNQINFIDWAADANAFSDAFTINERYLLADAKNSIIGKVNLNGSVDLIAYNAWGTPYTAQGANLEGLAVLWNGYYFDYETGNYYLRNRYYSPLERRFLTPDPHGVNPDGNWNNPFGPMRQYADGFGLQVYAGGDPVDGRDGWGLMSDLDLALKLMRNYIFPFRSDPFTEGAEVVKEQTLIKIPIADAMYAYAKIICGSMPKSPRKVTKVGYTSMDMASILSYAEQESGYSSVLACQDSPWMLHTLNGATGFNISGQFVAKRQCNKCEVTTVRL